LSEKVNKQGSKEDEFKESKAYQVQILKGKKIITTTDNAAKNHYLKVFPDPADVNNQCSNNKNKEGCIRTTSVTYTVRYISGKSSDIISYLPEKYSKTIFNYR
jgi:hypothetical protein